MSFKTTIFLAVLIALCFLTACQKVQTQKKLENFERSVTSYEVALRWAMHEDAYSYHISSEGVRPEVDLEKMNNINVTGINVIDRAVNDDQSEAIIKIVIMYYFKNEGTVKKLNLEQEWWYSEDNKQWFIKSDFPPFFL